MIYIGSTNNFLRRFKVHKTQLSNGVHENHRLQQAARQSWDYLHFEVRVVLVDLSKKNLLLWESLELEEIPRKKRYNIATPVIIKNEDGEYSVQSRRKVPSYDELKLTIFGDENE